MKKMTALLTLLLAAVLTLAACGNGETSNSSGDTGTTNAQFNDADVKFATDMIPHHEQAVQMARMAKSHARSAEVKALASSIEVAQGPEIDTMEQWLEAWGEDDSSSMGQEDMGHGSSSEMPGMLDSDEIEGLDNAHGSGWDQMFLTMMIAHHEGAIEMARTEQADGKNPDAVALAKKIEADQTDEIAQMKDMLKR